jgi:uncharacterized protein YabN with tetrapyrrole methylase and pyrophosphatase domain
VNDTFATSSDAFDIYIVGLGIVAVRHVTREVEAALRRSNEILFLAKAFGIDDYLRRMCPRVTDLHSAAYSEGGGRLNSYHVMAARVLDAAIKHPPVTFALYGHPMVFVYPSRQILEAAGILGLRVQVLPGISAMDCLFVDLALDPALEGLQMYEATDLLLRERPLQPDVPCLLWQVGAVETRLYTEARSRPERFTRIKNYLLRFYPPDHKVIAVYSATHPFARSHLTAFALNDIETVHEKLHQSVTLYVPSVTARPIANQQLLAQIDSVAHLEAMTLPSETIAPESNTRPVVSVEDTGLASVGLTGSPLLSPPHEE